MYTWKLHFCKVLHGFLWNWLLTKAILSPNLLSLATNVKYNLSTPVHYYTYSSVLHDTFFKPPKIYFFTWQQCFRFWALYIPKNVFWG
ncbi:hypothetical protein GDO86_005450 [Hymenochirus boettgeri]|uniref:Uncharacterized protein n=1 Tax=Hymenochirus boettgeri TaxID=247094 RepID=A0A8T2J7D1_9PIPI|nr:hypothetical protein GDO86_005450 [Hymenochirus boettgeri]